MVFGQKRKKIEFGYVYITGKLGHLKRSRKTQVSRSRIAAIMCLVSTNYCFFTKMVRIATRQLNRTNEMSHDKRISRHVIYIIMMQQVMAGVTSRDHLNVIN